MHVATARVTSQSHYVQPVTFRSLNYLLILLFSGQNWWSQSLLLMGLGGLKSGLLLAWCTFRSFFTGITFIPGMVLEFKLFIIHVLFTTVIWVLCSLNFFISNSQGTLPIALGFSPLFRFLAHPWRCSGAWETCGMSETKNWQTWVERTLYPLCHVSSHVFFLINETEKENWLPKLGEVHQWHATWLLGQGLSFTAAVNEGTDPFSTLKAII